MIIALDPGPVQTAVVHLNGGMPTFSSIMETDAVIRHLRDGQGEDAVAIEMIACYGMPVGSEVFATCVNIGRFIGSITAGRPINLIKRQEVKLNLCRSVRANDATIRQALIDRFGPGKDRAIGTKKAPGPLYGIKADMWAALAVACTWHDGVRGEALVA